VTNEYFHSMFRDLRIELLAGAGHMMHIEKPEAIAMLCADFVRTLAARGLLSSG